jgi:hypothetical protein
MQHHAETALNFAANFLLIRVKLRNKMKVQ